MRAVAALAITFAAVAGVGCAANKNVGAVVVRWRLLDALAGTIEAGCAMTVDAADGGVPAPLTVDQVQLTVERAALQSWFQTFAPVACASCVFCCGPREGTTEFEIPVDPDTGSSTYAFGLRALRCGRPVGSTPPPVVRSVRAGEVTNLGAVEIQIPPTQAPDVVLCDGVDMLGAACR